MITENNGKRGDLRNGSPHVPVPPLVAPRFMDLLDRLLSCLPLEERAETHLLQIGIDSGDLAVRILEDRVLSRLTVMDDSADALRLLGAGMKQFGVRFKASYGRPEKYIQPEHFHAVLSHLFLHEMSNEDKIAVCRNVFDALKPGGLFAFSVVQPNSQRWISGLRDAWHVPYAVPPEFWILWLEKIGFEKCRYVLHESIFGIFRAFKPTAHNA
ncbi:MAG: class I SAM-dependent methyltransferase [Acidobacteriota bacterium]|nr:class I SAM-dependent methyltransferase [Acidobacteriota bacterium]